VTWRSPGTTTAPEPKRLSELVRCLLFAAKNPSRNSRRPTRVAAGAAYSSYKFMALGRGMNDLNPQVSRIIEEFIQVGSQQLSASKRRSRPMCIHISTLMTAILEDTTGLVKTGSCGPCGMGFINMVIIADTSMFIAIRSY
jgi:hypothetical protein